MLPGAANNTGGFKNADYQKNVDLATNQDANDPSQRWADMVEAAQVLNRTQSLTPLYQNETGYLQNPKVKGIIIILLERSGVIRPRILRGNKPPNRLLLFQVALC